MKLKIKYLALSSVMLISSAIAMEDKEPEDILTKNDNKVELLVSVREASAYEHLKASNNQDQSNSSLNKFIKLYREAYKIRHEIVISYFDATMEVWEILNKNQDATESQFLEMLNIIKKQGEKPILEDELNKALYYININETYKINESSGSHLEEYPSDLLEDNNNPQKKLEILKLIRNEANKKLLKILVDFGADINFNKVPKNKVLKFSSGLMGINCGGSLLHRAVRANSSEWIKFLVNEMDADINNQDTRNRTPIFVACKQNNLEAAKVLLGLPNIKVNLKDSEGRTPLYLAVLNRNFKMVELLQDFGAVLTPKEEVDDELDDEYQEIDNTTSSIKSTKSSIWGWLSGAKHKTK